MEKKITTHKVTILKGALPEMGATDWWTEEDWLRHELYVEDLKAKGEYLQPEEITISITHHPALEDISANNFTISKSMYFMPQNGGTEHIETKYQ
jgi:hypothetical protein